MSAFEVQNLRGFDVPPAPPARGLIGIGQDETHEEHPFAVSQELANATSAFDALITHQQLRAPFATIELGQPGLIGVGGLASHFVYHVAFTLRRNNEVLDYAQAQQNAAALALIMAWLEEDPGGAPSSEWYEIQKSLDANRLSSRKLFP